MRSQHKVWFRVVLKPAPGSKITGDLICMVEALEQSEAIYKAYRYVSDKTQWALGSVSEVKEKKKAAKK